MVARAKIPKKRRESVPYSTKLARYICEKVEDGMRVKTICEQYKDIMPEEKTIWKWRRTKPKFKEMIDIAYQTLMYMTLDELDYVSKNPPNILSVADKYNLTDLRQVQIQLTAEMRAWAERLSKLKLDAVKLAPKIVP